VVGGIVHPHHNHGGAAVMGAMVGGMAGAAHKSKKDAQKEQQAKQSAAATDKARIDSFRKAYSACLEGKGYSVK
jgi:membrane protease subunit (stomatin/prohibitin family)